MFPLYLQTIGRVPTMSGWNSATRNKHPNTTSAATEARLFLYRRQTSDQKSCGSSRRGGFAGCISGATPGAADTVEVEAIRWSPPLVIRDTRIHHGVQQVRKQVSNHDEDREHHRQAHDDGIVPLSQRVEEQVAHARPTEDALENHAATKQPR